MQPPNPWAARGGVKRLYRLDPTISPFERISRIRKIGEIRTTINERTNPILNSHLDTVREQIQLAVAHQNILAIRQLLGTGMLTQEEADQAEQEAGAVLRVEKISAVTKEQKFNVFFPDGQSVETNDQVVVKIMEQILSAPQSTEQLTLVLWGEYNRQNMQTLHSKIQKVKRLAASVNWRVDQPVGPGQRRKYGQQAVYSLKPIDAVIEREQRPDIPEIPGLTIMEKKVLEAIWDTFESEEGIFTSDWASRSYKEQLESGQITMKTAKDRLFTLATKVGRKIREADLEIVSIPPAKGQPKGTETKHYIRQVPKKGVEPSLAEPKLPGKETFTIALPDGQLVETNDKDVSVLLNQLMSKPVERYNLTIALRGVYNPDIINLVTRKIRKAVSILPKNWLIRQTITDPNKGNGLIYSLQNVEDVKTEEESLSKSAVSETVGIEEGETPEELDQKEAVLAEEATPAAPLIVQVEKNLLVQDWRRLKEMIRKFIKG